jgi:uncharacterized membrane protein YgcG
MRCPFCSSPAQEILEQCPDCGFVLTEVQRIFGVAASLEPGLTDLDEIFSKGERRVLSKALEHFRRRFPQCQFSVVTNAHPSPNLPFSVYAFWLFNTSGICRKIDKGGDNHDLLLTIDAKRGLAALLVGYGLEPFVGPQHIGEILNAGKGELQSGNWADAVKTIVNAAESHLAGICSGLNQTFGIDIQKIYEADKFRTHFLS